MFDFLFMRKDPKTELEGLERAQKILDDRYNKGQILPEVYMKQSLEFQKRREACEKRMKKKGLL